MPVLSATERPDRRRRPDLRRSCAGARDRPARPRPTPHEQPQPRALGLLRGDPGGRPLTVQATGIGGPSAVAVLREAVRARRPSPDPRRHLRRDPAADRHSARVGSSRARRRGRYEPSAGRRRALAAQEPRTRPGVDGELATATGFRRTTVRSVDVIGAGDPTAGCSTDADVVVDLQTAAVLSLGRRLGVAAAAAVDRHGARRTTAPRRAARRGAAPARRRRRRRLRQTAQRRVEG